jgi:hypothetical protein
MFGHRVLRRMFGTTTDELTRGWRVGGGKNCNAQLHNLYSSVNITGIIKSWRMRHEENVRRGRREIHKKLAS